MTRSKAFAAVCVLLVLLGSSAAFALDDGSRNAAETPEQIAVPIGPSNPPDAQLIPKEDLILRDQSTTFVVRVENAGGTGGVLMCVDSRMNRPIQAGFHSSDVIPFSSPLQLGTKCRESAAYGYIPAQQVDEVESVPVSISATENFPIGEHDVTVETKFKSSPVTVTETFTLRVACPIECRLSLLWRTIVRNPELVIAVLSLLVAFFGRKRIWNALRLPRERATGIGGGESRDIETGGDDLPDAEVVEDERQSEE